MYKEIKTIRLDLPWRMGKVNCYLIDTGDGFVLVDTGGRNNRAALVKALEAAGCTPGRLKLILLTHGDFDHCGNAATLRDRFGGLVVMGAEDAGMVERGDMFYSRKQPNIVFRSLFPLFAGFGKEERFTPDVLVRDGDDLAEYGFAGRAISLPGHSRGSIGILTAGGELFCGDLLVGADEPVLNTLMDDVEAGYASLEKLAGMGIGRVYPGHGEPFALQRAISGIDRSKAKRGKAA
jgi:glyoxylase-like metal-dependent hydrolase (beta-lactamase superfamily II)